MEPGAAGKTKRRRTERESQMKAELRERVFSYMKKYQMTEQRKAAVIGVSGGADSVCLLLLLLELKERLDLTLSAVHVEHGIRGDSSRADADFVKRLCKRLEVPCVVHCEDVPRLAKERGTSLEETARDARYAVFAREAKRLEEESGKKCCIAVAHNANDNAETMLYHLVRGAGLHGLAGIPPVRGNIIRPLLFLKRDEIEEYLRSRGQDFCVDETNRDPVYRRNRIRHRVLPELEEMNPAAVEHMGRTAGVLREMEAYLEAQARSVLERANTEQGLLMEALRPLPDVLKKEALRLWLKQTPGERKDVAACHMDALAELLDAPVGKEIFLPGKRRAVAGYRYLTIVADGARKEDGCAPGTGRGEAAGLPESSEKIEKASDGEAVCPDEISAKMLEAGQTIRKKYPGTDGGKSIVFGIRPVEKSMKIPRNSYTKWFDYDKIKNNLVLRNRREGDFLVIDDQGRTKLLRRYLMDEKIPRDQRDTLPLLCSGRHVLWVIGYRISEAFKVSETTEKILEVQVMEEEENE